jgi:hypothetical protein
MKKENEFTWIVEQSKSIDKHLKKINNGLRSNTLERLISQSDRNMDNRYRQRYNVCSPDPRLAPTQTEHTLQVLTNIDKNLHNGRVRHNILMGMYDEWYYNLPYLKRIFTKRIKSDYYEISYNNG